jgi:Secretion system C-terminal sorting domain/SprB repeat
MKICFLLFFLFGFQISGIANSKDPLALSASATGQDALCPNQGVITITATGGTPFLPPSSSYTYQIISPSIYTTPIQSSNTFNSLLGGILYTVKIADQVSFVTVTYFVNNSYTPMVISATSAQPLCITNANDGKITGLVNIGGRSPFLYSITGPINVAYQNNNTITGLVTGNYILSIKDACGEIRTTAIFVPPATDFTFANVQFFSDDFNPGISFLPSTIVGNCSFVRGKPFSFVTQSIPAPLILNRTIRIYENLTNTLIYTNTVTTNLDNNFVTLQKNKEYRFEIYDNCNTTLIRLFKFLKKGVTFDYLYSNCGLGADVLINTKIPSTDSLYAASKDMPETFTLISGPSGIGNTITTNTNSATFTNLLAGDYTVSIVDQCETIIKNFNIPPLAAYSFSVFNTGESSCLDSTATRYFFPTNLFNNETILNYKVLTGPTSFVDVYGALRTITYPITLNTVGNEFKHGNYPKGNYTASAITSCGRTYNTNFSVVNADLTVRKYSINAVSQCTNSGSITYTKLGQNWGGEEPILRLLNSASSINPTSQIGNTTTWNNLPTAVYKLTNYTNAVAQNIVSGNCPRVIFDTTINLSYTIPTTTAIIALACADGSNAQITVNSVVGGSAPFMYEIISGPVIRPLQSSNIFNNLPEGTYNVRTVDACGNAVVTSASTARLLPSVTVTGVNCNEISVNTVLLNATNYPNATYNWIGPNGFTYIGNPVSLINFNAATQSGLYLLQVNFSNCPTINVVTNVSNCTTVPLKLLSFISTFNNCANVLHWKTTEEKNVDYFEIQASNDAIHFNKINKVLSNNSTVINNYSFSTYNQEYNTFFRLKIVDKDGKFIYSDIIQNTKNCNSIISVTPNPFTSFITISGLTGLNDIILYNDLGQIMYNQKSTLNFITIPTTTFSKGSYFLKVISKTEIIKKIIIKNN